MIGVSLTMPILLGCVFVKISAGVEILAGLNIRNPLAYYGEGSQIETHASMCLKLNSMWRLES